jgi:hypothetical protein
MSYLKEIIRGRTVGLMVHGKSIEWRAAAQARNKAFQVSREFQ